MSALASRGDLLVVFLILAALKGLTESYAYRHVSREGGEQSSRFLSAYFMMMGLLTPVLVLLEILVLRHSVPIAVSVACAASYAALLFLRVMAIRTLGQYYSVNIRVAKEHRLITHGVYRRLRHPIYLVGLLESFFYPMAAGAYVSAALLVMLGSPAILIRRSQEERQLLQRFGQQYEEYRRTTWF